MWLSLNQGIFYSVDESTEFDWNSGDPKTIIPGPVQWSVETQK